MNGMPGNPYATASLANDTQGSMDFTAQATLALAYEQRTANLIAYAQVADDETADTLWVDHIAPRLGLGDER